MTNLFILTKNYWHYTYIPVIYPKSQKNLGQFFCQESFKKFDEEIRKRGLYNSSLHIQGRLVLEQKMRGEGFSPMIFHFEIGLN